jgi:hypothetical protein
MNHLRQILTSEFLLIFVYNFCVFLREKWHVGRCKRPQHVIVQSTKICKNISRHIGALPQNIIAHLLSVVEMILDTVLKYCLDTTRISVVSSMFFLGNMAFRICSSGICITEQQH